jgi:hypothetical protein
MNDVRKYKCALEYLEIILIIVRPYMPQDIAYLGDSVDDCTYYHNGLAIVV